MLLLKIGWSLIVTKNTQEEINQDYLRQIQDFLETFKDETTIITHGTGNVWHGFVQQFWLTKDNWTLLRKDLDDYFRQIDTHIPWYKRIRAEDVVTGKYTIQNKDKIICGGDITSVPTIISSDDVFSYILHHHTITNAYMLTDVDGVYDIHKTIINEITKDTLDTIHFRKKDGDVTWAMQQKIKKLFDYISKGEKRVWIINWGNIENFDKILKTGKGIGSKIII